MAKTIATLLNEAAASLDKYDLGSATKLYMEVLSREPNNAAGAMGMAMVFNRTGKPADALQLLNQIWAALARAKPKLPAQQQAAVLAQIGLSHQEMGQLDLALDSYKQAQGLMPSEDLNRRVAQILPLLGSPAPVQQLILYGRKLVSGGQFAEAAKAYMAALKLQPDNADALHDLAMIMQSLGVHDEVMPLMQKAVVLAPDRPEFFNDLGILYQQRDEVDKAINYHRRAIKLAPRFVFAHINLGVAYKRLGQNEASLAAYRSAIAIDPESPEVHNNLGNLLRVMGDLEQARMHLRRALALRPAYSDAQSNLNSVLEAMGERVIAQPGQGALNSPRPVSARRSSGEKAVGVGVATGAPKRAASPKKAVAVIPAAKKAGASKKKVG